MSAVVDTPAPDTPAPDTPDTPRLLNRWQLAGTAIVLLFGVLSALLQFLAWSADGRAADDTDQLVRVQGIQSELLRADALATSSFLAGDQPSDRAAEYDAALESVLTGIADAAEAQPADGDALAELNVAVNEYVATVARAQATDQQDLPAGAEELTSASAELREEVLPLLEGLVAANTARAEDSMGGQQPVLLVVVGVAALGGLWWLNRQLARAFHRHLNVGLAIAALLVLGTMTLTTIMAAFNAAGNDDVRAGDFRTAIDQAAARTAANDAKASESLRLIERDAGTTHEEAWEEAADVVEEHNDPELTSAWGDYVAVHESVVTADEDGNWEGAVTLATSDRATAQLDEFDDASQEVIAESAEDATDALRGDRWLAMVLAIATLVVAVVAAGFVARGIGERRREFA